MAIWQDTWMRMNKEQNKNQEKDWLIFHIKLMFTFVQNCIHIFGVTILDRCSWNWLACDMGFGFNFGNI